MMGDHNERDSSVGRDYSVQSPSNLNKSVSFSQSVKVREFPSNSNRTGKKRSKYSNNGAAEHQMPQRRLEYDHASPARMERGYSSGGNSSARHNHYDRPN